MINHNDRIDRAEMLAAEVRVKLSTDEINKMCDRLKYKYPQYEKREDLKSEAILAIYERLASHPDAHPAELYNIARLAMSDFINLKDKVVTLPANPTTRAVATNQRLPKSSEYGANGISAMEETLQPTTEYVEVDSKTFAQTEDCSEKYETEEFIAKAMALLNDKERAIITMRYFEHKTQGEVSKILGVTQQAIFLQESSILSKMSKL
tara:strand:+ start:119 stop:742 length:624 start_codon:yes stop_codon:yes gene_type:complete